MTTKKAAKRQVPNSTLITVKAEVIQAENLYIGVGDLRSINYDNVGLEENRGKCKEVSLQRCYFVIVSRTCA